MKKETHSIEELKLAADQLLATIKKTPDFWLRHSFMMSYGRLRDRISKAEIVFKKTQFKTSQSG